MRRIREADYKKWHIVPSTCIMYEILVSMVCMYDFCRPQDLHHSQSDTFRHMATSTDGNGSGVMVGYDDLPPPPPPPIYEDEESPPSQAVVRRNLPVDTMVTGGTGTSKSTMSAASFTLTSNASVLSSQTDESEEEGGSRRRVSHRHRYCLQSQLIVVILLTYS